MGNKIECFILSNKISQTAELVEHITFLTLTLHNHRYTISPSLMYDLYWLAATFSPHLSARVHGKVYQP